MLYGKTHLVLAKFAILLYYVKPWQFYFANRNFFLYDALLGLLPFTCIGRQWNIASNLTLSPFLWMNRIVKTKHPMGGDSVMFGVRVWFVQFGSVLYLTSKVNWSRGHVILFSHNLLFNYIRWILNQLNISYGITTNYVLKSWLYAWVVYAKMHKDWSVSVVLKEKLLNIKMRSYILFFLKEYNYVVYYI